LSNNHSLTKYWNLCFTEYSKLTQIYVRPVIFSTHVIFLTRVNLLTH